jgi:hypothetical protein
VEALANHIAQPRFPDILKRFLFKELNPDTAAVLPEEIPLNLCPAFIGRISVFHSLVAHFFAPSDLCGAGGMYQERIRSHPHWRREYARHDTVFIQTESDQGIMRDMVIGQLRLLFSLTFNHKHFVRPCRVAYSH